MQSRMGTAQAITATAHTLARLVSTLLTHGTESVQQGLQEDAARYRDRAVRNVARKARELAFERVPATNCEPAPRPCPPSGGIDVLHGPHVESTTPPQGSSDRWETGTEVPNEAKIYWARYSEWLPSCKLGAMVPTIALPSAGCSYVTSAHSPSAGKLQLDFKARHLLLDACIYMEIQASECRYHQSISYEMLSPYSLYLVLDASSSTIRASNLSATT